MLLTYKENVHSTQMYIPLKPLFSRHKGIGVQFTDEPTGALDYNTSNDILKLIEDVNKKYGNTIIIVTHNDAIKNMADRVITLRDGRIRKNYVNDNKIPAADLEW